MTATAHMRGHSVYHDGDVWRHVDDDSLAPGSGGEERPCIKCGFIAESEYGPDPCLGYLRGATSACCGHGVESPTIVYHQHTWVDAATDDELQARWVCSDCGERWRLEVHGEC